MNTLNNHSSNGIPSQPIIPKEDVIDVKKYLLLFLRRWYWFLLSLIVCVAASWLYLKYTPKVWEISTTILIEESKQSSTAGVGMDKIMQGFGLNPGLQNIENQIVILSSRSLVSKAIAELPLKIEYYYKGKINKSSLYRISPIEVTTDRFEFLPEGIEFSVYPFGDDRLRIMAEQNELIDLDVEARWGEQIQMGDHTITLSKTGFWTSKRPSQPIHFQFHSNEALVRLYRERLEVVPASLDATILKISLQGEDPFQDRDFLLKLTEVFLRNNLEKKNKEADRAIEFIGNQLANISDSLLLTEDRLQRFRSRNRVVNISEQGSRIMEQAIDVEEKQAQLTNEANYYKYLMDYLQEDDQEKQIIAPSTMGISDPMLIKLIEQLTEYQTKYYRYGVTSNDSPMKVALQSQILNTKNTLLEVLENIAETTDLAVKENADRLKKLNGMAASLPATERELLGFQRKFKLNDALYTLLLERQAEAKIQRASNMPDNEVIDPASWEKFPVKPKSHIVYIIGLMFAFALPSFILVFVDTVDQKIRSEEDIKKITSLPILGYIPHSKDYSRSIVFNEPKSPITEAFRSLRSHLRFLIKDNSSSVVLVTSSLPGEGKSLSSTGLASILSLTGKDTVLIGADLRKPVIGREFKLANGHGLSTYLSGQHKIEEILFPTRHKNFWIIPAGPIPPNPSELLNSDRLKQLVDELKGRFNYIIIDSAPLGAVADTYGLTEISDSIIMVVRPGESNKKILDTTLTELKTMGINNTSILINDLKNGIGFKAYYYGYRRNKLYQ
jgi:capsular exopolysaccharide synthesis family protein